MGDIRRGFTVWTRRLAIPATVLLLIWTMAWLAMLVGTDYRFANEGLQRAHWSLPLLLLLASLLAVRATRPAPARALRRLVANGSLLIGSGLTIVLYLVLPLRLLPYAYLLEPMQPVTVQHLVSSDRSKVAEVAYYAPVMSVASMGTLTVSATYLVSGVPVVTREVYAQPLHDALFNGNPQPYRHFVHWQGDDTLVVPSARLRIALTPLRVSLTHTARRSGSPMTGV